MKILIIGCGRVGANLSHILSMRGHDLTIVDKDPEAFRELGTWFKGKTYVGIGFDKQLLLEAGIERADGLAAVTLSDEANVVVARLAQQFFRVPRVAARVYDPRKAEIYRRLGLQTISPVTIGSLRLAELLSFNQLTPVATLGSGEVEIVQAEINTFLVGHPVRDLVIAGQIKVVSITRRGKTFLPDQSTAFEKGDIVQIATTISAADRLAKMLEQ
ncbi:potassium transporter TrkA [Ornatilinea apprima]|uniref:Trk system potassium uptake protein TrkA n=1 Tax=Ornatilinea apprima TaxID=1134406 RepID=A0A0P6XSZ5_9CHLR|nr:TrkA family potassium uptake protein [Ornatilinea apprima]KPL76088.1 potassium transporter TrkA [Ornatilinea apprima]